MSVAAAFQHANQISIHVSPDIVFVIEDVDEVLHDAARNLRSVAGRVVRAWRGPDLAQAVAVRRSSFGTFSRTSPARVCNVRS